MDKKTMLIVGGAFILGGLTIGAMAGIHERYSENNNHFEGMMGSRAGDHSYGHHTASIDADRMGGMKDGTTMEDGDTTMEMNGMHDMNMTVTSERDFLQKMIPHHEEAVASAKEVVARGGSTPEIKTLAENIITAQEKEIGDMKTWFKSWYGVDYTSDGKYEPMMRPLAALSGAALDKVFLNDMILHHKGALMMASSVTAHIEHPEVTTLVGNINTTQSAEITEMQNILKTLK